MSVHRCVARPGVSETDRTTDGDFLVTRSTVSRSVRGDSTLSARSLSNSRSRSAPSLWTLHAAPRVDESRLSHAPHVRIVPIAGYRYRLALTRTLFEHERSTGHGTVDRSSELNRATRNACDGAVATLLNYIELLLKCLQLNLCP